MGLQNHCRVLDFTQREMGSHGTADSVGVSMVTSACLLPPTNMGDISGTLGHSPEISLQIPVLIFSLREVNFK